MTEIYELQKEIKLIKEYNSVLEIENNARNQERKALQIQISRLSQLLKQKQSKKTYSVDSQSHHYKAQIKRLQKQLLQLKNINKQISVKNERIENSRISETEKIRYNQLALKYDEINLQNLNMKRMMDNYDVKNFQQKIRKLQFENSDLKSKVNSLQSEIRSQKVQISSNQSVIASLQVRKEQNTQVSTLNSEIISLKSIITKKQTQISTIKNSQQSYQTQIQHYKSKYEQQLTLNSQLKNQKLKNSSCNQQNIHLAQQLRVIKQQLEEKERTISRLQVKDIEKNNQVQKLDLIVNSYMEKIQILEMELKKFQIHHNSDDKFKISMESYREENKVLNQRVKDFQRRIYILEEANLSLRQELQYSIQSRKRQSRISTMKNQQDRIDEELLQTIKVLKNQLQQLSQSNQSFKQQNSYLREKILNVDEDRKSLMKNNLSFSKNETPHFYHQHIPVSEIGFVRKTKLEDKNQRYINSKSQHFRVDSLRQVQNNNRRPEHESQKQYKNDLQKKIDRLKQQNQGLRKHLYE